MRIKNGDNKIMQVKKKLDIKEILQRKTENTTSKSAFWQRSSSG